MFNLRRIQSDQDLEKAKSCVPEGCAEPTWNNCVLIERDGQVIGVGGFNFYAKAEPLFMTALDPVGYLMLAAHLDGMARQLGVKEYEFFVQDIYPEHQAFVEKHLPVSWGEEKPGKTYFRKLD